MSFAALNTKTSEKESDLRAVGLLGCGKVSRLKIIFFGLVKELRAMETKYGTGIPCICCLVRSNWLFLMPLGYGCEGFGPEQWWNKPLLLWVCKHQRRFQKRRSGKQERKTRWEQFILAVS